MGDKARGAKAKVRGPSDLEGRAEAQGDCAAPTGDLIDRVLSNKRRAPDAVELWAIIEEEFGGSSRFAEELKKCYDSCEEGSATQARMMSLFLEMRCQAVAAAKQDVTDGISTEDLEKIIKFMVGQARNE